MIWSGVAIRQLISVSHCRIIQQPHQLFERTSWKFRRQCAINAAQRDKSIVHKHNVVCSVEHYIDCAALDDRRKQCLVSRCWRWKQVCEDRVVFERLFMNCMPPVRDVYVIRHHYDPCSVLPVSKLNITGLSTSHAPTCGHKHKLDGIREHFSVN